MVMYVQLSSSLPYCTNSPLYTVPKERLIAYMLVFMLSRMVMLVTGREKGSLS